MRKSNCDWEDRVASLLLHPDLKLLVICNRRGVDLILKIELLDFTRHSGWLNVRHKKRQRNETRELLSVALDQKCLTAPCDAIENFTRRASQLHHWKSFEFNWHFLNVVAQRRASCR